MFNDLFIQHVKTICQITNSAVLFHKQLPLILSTMEVNTANF